MLVNDSRVLVFKLSEEIIAADDVSKTHVVFGTEVNCELLLASFYVLDVVSLEDLLTPVCVVSNRHCLNG